MNQAHYLQQRQAEQHHQLQPHLNQSQDSSRGSLALQAPNNTFDRMQQHQEAWPQTGSFSQSQQVQQDLRDLHPSSHYYTSSMGSQGDAHLKNQEHHHQQHYGKMSLDSHSVTQSASSQQRQSSAKNALVQRSHETGAKGGFFAGAGQGELITQSGQNDNMAQYLNKTQVTVENPKSSVNERANRINLHRSNRQRSHQGHHRKQPTAQPDFYGTQGKAGNGSSGHGGPKNESVSDLSIKLKNKGSDLDVAYYHQQAADSAKNSTSQHYRYGHLANESEADGSSSNHQQEHQFYHTQKIDNTGMYLNQQHDFKQSSSYQKDRQNDDAPGAYQGQDGASLNNSQLSNQQQQQRQPDAYHRRGSDANYAQNNYKKKVQPQQPRSREESRRKGAGGVGSHNKSSETTNSCEQSSQNSSQCQQQPQVQVQNAYQAQKIDNDKFSQLVCQVPQGKTSPQMAQNAVQISNSLIQVQDSQTNFNNQYLLGPQRPSEAGRKTLVLDLDETLVHSSFKPVDNADIMLPVEIDGQICTIYVLVRPFVDKFLKAMHKIYELVIFTASLSKYAEPLMSHLDPQKMCSYLLFREHCTFFNNAYVKDLTRLGRPMKDVIIVDNSPVAYLFQPENAMPAVSWYDDPTDTELQRIAALLDKLNQEDDVRKIIRMVIQNNKIDPRQEQLYMASAQHRRDKSQQVTRRAKHSKLTQNEQQATSSATTEQTQPQVVIQKVHNQQHHTYTHQQQQQLPQQDPQAEQSQIQLRNQQQQQQAASGNNSGHSRYDSSDTRQRNAAMISEELNQRKRGDQDNLNMEIVLSNVQKLTQQTKPHQLKSSTSPLQPLNSRSPWYQTSPGKLVKEQETSEKDLQYESELKKSMHQNQKDIQQAYQHHKNQILQLQNEIAALKSQHSDQTPRNSAAEQQKQQQQQRHHQHPHLAQQEHQAQAVSSKSHLKTTGQATRVTHQQIGDNNDTGKVSPVKQGNKGQKQRESVRNQQHNHYEGSTTAAPKPQPGRQQRQSYKILSSNEIQLVNYIKSGSNGPSANNAANTGNQRHPVHGGVEKKQLVVRESAGNNSQLHNTKQIIKLIKKTEGHQSNCDVTSSARKNFQQLESSNATAQATSQVSQPNIGNQQSNASYSQRQQHPATTKSQSKQHFAFSQNGQQQPTPSGAHAAHEGSHRSRVTQQTTGQQQQPFSGQINMMTSSHGQSRGQQASRASSKTTKNYSVVSTNQSTVAGGNIRTSYSSQKNGHTGKPAAQSSLQTHDRISSGNVVSSAGATKRSSSVKSPVSSSHHGHRKGSSSGEQPGRDHNNVRKSNNTLQNGSSQAYGNLVSYEQPTGHHRRERGSSAQPLYTGNNHGNPLLVTNLVSRSSSTTNKNKKVNSISGTGNFHNLVLNGSHSTKHSTQNVANSGASGQTGTAQHRGGSQDRHQKAGSSTRQSSSRVKTSKTATGGGTGHHHHGSDSKDGTDQHPHTGATRVSSKQSSQQQQFSLKQQQEHLQRMQQMTTNGNNQKQQLSVTQRISPGTMLSLSGQQYAAAGQNSQQLLDQSLTPSHHQQHASALVKQNMKDIQVQDMLRLTQNNGQAPQGYFNNGMSSTRNQKQVQQISGSFSMQQPDTEDFLKKVKMQQQVGAKTSSNADPHKRHNEGGAEKPSSKQAASGSIQMLHQEVAISKSSQGHQNTGPGLSIKSPKYQNSNVPGSQTCASAAGGAARDQQKILNDIMNIAVQREQKSGSAATSYGTKQQVVMATTGQAQGSSGSHQIKKIRISSTQQGTNGRMSGQSNQSAPNHHKSTGLKRGDSNNSRGSHSGAIHQVVRSSGTGQAKSREKDHARQGQIFNQTMKLKDTGGRGGNNGQGILSLLNDLGEGQNKNQTAADLFLKSHNEEQFSQTQYFGASNSGPGGNGAQNQGSHNNMGQSQLREVTRHFYNQLTHAGNKKQHHH